MTMANTMLAYRRTVKMTTVQHTVQIQIANYSTAFHKFWTITESMVIRDTSF